MQMLFIEVWGLLDSEQHGFEEMSNTKCCMFFFDDVSLSSDCNVDVIDVAHMTFTNIVFFLLQYCDGYELIVLYLNRFCFTIVEFMIMLQVTQSFHVYMTISRLQESCVDGLVM